MEFSILNQEPLSFTRNIPAALARYQLPVGSGSSAVNQEDVQILLQESGTPRCRLIHTVYRMGQDTHLRVRAEGPYFLIPLALQQDRHLEFKGLGPVHLKEGQYNFLYCPEFDVTCFLEEGREYITISLNYDCSALEEWTTYFPVLADFLEKVKAGRPAMLLPQHQWINQEIQDALYRVTHTALDTPAYEIYFDLMVKTLLFHLLLQSVQPQPASPYTHHEIDGIHAAREMIRKNIRRHFIIREIAQKVGVNEFKLKNGFRELFGNGVYEYLRTERMQEARTLLDRAGHSIKEVASLTGYKSVNSFIKAFKKKYGLTPGEYRRSA